MSAKRRLKAIQRREWAEELREERCHCNERVTFGFDGDPTHHRGMCAHCDPIRCDAYPGECGR